MLSAHIVRLLRYPIKGFDGQTLNEVAVTPGETFPLDRAFAVENGPSGFDPTSPRHFPKSVFLMRMKNAELARLSIRFDDKTLTLEISEDGEKAAVGRLDEESGRAAIEAYLAKRFADDLRGPPRILHVDGHSFSDVAAKRIHLVNLETVRAVGKRVGKTLNPERFRANIYIDGIPAWEEFSWLDKDIVAGGVKFTVISRTKRCAAVDVDPETAERDTTLPKDLLRAYDHADLGVYLSAETAGKLRTADSLALA